MESENRISYYNPYTDALGRVYSIDMMKLSFQSDFGVYENELKSNLLVNSDIRKVKLHEETGRAYRYFAEIHYLDYSSISIGMFFQFGRMTQSHDGFIRFNPNKLQGCAQFWKDLQFFLSSVKNCSLIRADLAIDIPIPRNKILMVKDRRNYSLKSKSPLDRTEYLGVKHNHNYVKLYNKSLESGLPAGSDITRLELSFTHNDIHIPAMYDLTKYEHVDCDYMRLILTNDYPTDALINISKYKRKKFLEEQINKTMEFDNDGIQHCFNIVSSIIDQGGDYGKQQN